MRRSIFQGNRYLSALLVLCLTISSLIAPSPIAPVAVRAPTPKSAIHAQGDVFASATAPGESTSLSADLAERFPILKESLSIASTFMPASWQIGGRTIEGLQPSNEPCAPSGLKPEEQAAWLAMAKRQGSDPSAGLTMFFAQSYRDGCAVRAGGLEVWSRPLGGSASTVEDDEGRLVYRDVYPHTDVIHTVAAGRSEEFIHLADPSAPTSFEYELSNAAGDLRVVADNGGLLLSDAAGHQVRIEAPWVIDATGLKSLFATSWKIDANQVDGHQRLALNLDPTGLTYPMVIDPTWRANGSMATGRQRHTATLLPSGKVLVAGGYGGNSYGINGDLASCELYDPSVGTWSITGSLTTARSFHTATLLLSGKVLVTGGYSFATSSTLSSCELYDPSTGIWGVTGSMARARSNFTVVLLNSGKVLVMDSYLYCELYDPNLGTWSATGAQGVARGNSAATLLSSGKVLLAGGNDSSSELYDPNVGTWSPTGSLTTTRSQHTAILLNSGKVLVMGGTNGISKQASCELYDPISGTWSTTGSLATARASHTATLLPSGKVLVTGGNYSGVIASCELYDPSVGTWSVTGSLATHRELHTATLLPSGMVMVTGGHYVGAVNLGTSEFFDPNPVIISPLTATGVVGSAFSYQIASDTNLISYNTIGLPTGLTVDTITGLITGTPTIAETSNVSLIGTHAAGSVAGSLVITIAPMLPNAWSNTGSLSIARNSHTATSLLSGKILVAGGNSGSDSLASCELYDPTLGVWSTTGSLGTSRFGHTATLLSSGKVLVTSGLRSVSPGSYTGVTSCEIYDPSAGTWSYAGSIAEWRSHHSATLLPSGMVLVTGGEYYYGSALGSSQIYTPNAGSGIWSMTGPLVTTRGYNTATLLPSGMIMVAGGLDSGFGWRGLCELYDPSLGTWSLTGTLAMARYSHSATLLPSGNILVTGGYGDYGYGLTVSEIYDSNVGTWSSAGALATGRFDHSATALSSGKILVTGGRMSVGSYLASSERYNPSAGTWIATGLLATPRSYHTASLLPSGKVLVTGGCNSSGSLGTCELYVPMPVITSALTATGDITSPFTYQITSDDTLTGYSASDLPAGLAVNTVTGEITGIPTSVGTINATITVANSDGISSAILAITIAAVPPAGVLSFSAITSSHFEGDSVTSTVTITATRTSGSYGAIGVNYSTNNGTAIAGSDYAATSGTLNWADGDASDKTFNITINGDTTFENNETVQLSLSSPTGGATLGTSSATLTIINDDAVQFGVLAFSAATYSDSEGNSGTSSVTITATRTGGSDGSVAVNYSTANGTASAGSDYAVASGTLTWADGDAVAKIFTVSINGDAVFESDETVLLSLSSPTGGATLGTSSATLTITNDDPAPGGSLAFSAATYSKIEGATTATITVTRTGGSSGAVSVGYATADGTATAGTDYVAKSGTLSWVAGDVAAKTFAITILSDTLNESDETVDLSLSNPIGAILGTGSATLTLIDNDEGGTLSFSAATYSKPEGNSLTSTMTITATRSGGSTGAVSVTYATADGTATAGSDYEAASGTLSWLAGDIAVKTFTVTVNGDTINESNETVILSLSSPTNGATLGTSSSTFTIANDDTAPGGVLAFSAATYSKVEGNSLTSTVVITATRTGGSSGAAAVSYATADGTATAGLDYTAKTGTLSWLAGDIAAKTFAVTITGDTVNESDETVLLSLSNPTGATLGTSSATLTIVNNDEPGTVSFSAPTYSKIEGNSLTSLATITATRTGGSTGAVSVTYATADGTATAGSDYTAKTGTLSWVTGNVAAKTFTITITGDTVNESDETVTLSLSAPTGGASLGTSSATLTIVNNDSPGTLSFSAPTYSKVEGNSLTSLATITATRTGGSTGAVSVSYATADGTATAGSDYTAKTGTLSWLAGDVAAKTFTITITGDTVNESDETVALSLSAPTGGASLGTSSAFLTIVNNDAPGTLSFSAPTYSKVEGNSLTSLATITATRTDGSMGAVSVSYATADGTATAGSDYTTKTGTLSWLTGDVVAKTFTITITGDTVNESDETVALSLSAPTGGASLGTSSAILTILNNDAPGTLSFSAPTYSKIEGNSLTSLATITATRTGGSTGAVSVSYATADGTATAGSDYTAKTGTLSWLTGDVAAKTFTVTVTGDTVNESDETVALNLSAPTGGAILGTSSATLTILNNDSPGTLSFSAPTYSKIEGNTLTSTATVIVTRTGGSTGAVSVSYATADGTATAGSDYVAKTGTLTWLPGDVANKSFTITISGDTVNEGDESVLLSLNSPTGGASLGSGSAALIVINNDAPGTLSFSAGTYRRTEGNSLPSTVVITATRTGGSTGAVGVSYATSDGTATAGSDYTAKTGTLSWLAGDIAAKTFTITIAGDTTFESDETVLLDLSGPTGGASLGISSATLTVVNDDAAAAIAAAAGIASGIPASGTDAESGGGACGLGSGLTGIGLLLALLLQPMALRRRR